jgi:hypothetical protein
MRIRLAGLAILAVAGVSLAACDKKPAAASAATEAAEPDMPVRKPGLWKQTLLVGGDPFVQDVKLCLDAEAEKKVSWWGKKGLRADCVEDEIVQQPDGSWRFSSVCVGQDHVKTTTRGSTVGDFQRRYQINAEMTISNPADPRQSGTRSMTLDAEWLGPCPSGMKPGQLDYPSGESVNLLDLAGPDQN